MGIRRLSLLAVTAGFWGLVAACGYEDAEYHDEIVERQQDCDGTDCEEDDTEQSRDHDQSVHPRVDEAHDSEADDRDGRHQSETSRSDESFEPDLQCAEDEEICRFCGPPRDVVDECPEDDDRFECRVFELVNEIRADHGLDELDYDGTLAESAMIHAMDLNHCDYFAHDSLDGTDFFGRCEANGYAGTCTGENIGGGQSTPEDVVDAWMESPSHRDNILYEHHTEIGIAYYEGGGTYGEYWLKHFGRR